jgi:23S rRNA pseudouridine1911/1915/1917 synthase
MKQTITINEGFNSIRLDQFLSEKFSDYSRNYFANLIKSGYVKVNESTSKSSYRIKAGDMIEVNFIEIETIDLGPEKIPLNIIYEDKDVIVINKQAGLVVHPALSTKNGTLINALLAHFPQIKNAVYDKESKVSLLRPGLVHRLDKDTSGTIIVAKNARAMHSLSRQMQNRTVKKIYWAICAGWPKNENGELVNFLGRSEKNRKEFTEVGENKGKKAISKYNLLDYFFTKDNKKVSLIEFDIKTGRTHQIRSQAKLAGFPIIGDTSYFNKDSREISAKYAIPRQLLHSKNLSITLPGENRPRTFEAELPEDFKKFLSTLNKK